MDILLSKADYKVGDIIECSVAEGQVIPSDGALKRVSQIPANADAASLVVTGKNETGYEVQINICTPIEQSGEAKAKAKDLEVLANGSFLEANAKSKILTELRNNKKPVPVTLLPDTIGAKDGVVVYAGAATTSGNKEICGFLDRDVTDFAAVSRLVQENPKGVSAEAVAVGGMVDGVLVRDENAKDLVIKVPVKQQAEQGDFSEEIRQAVLRGGGPQNQVIAAVDTMINNKVPDSLIVAVLRSRKYCRELTACMPETPFFGTAGEMAAAIQSILMRTGELLLKGSPGTGKNILIQTLAACLNKPVVRIQGNADMDKIDLLGGEILENGNVRFRISEALQCLERGGWLVLDEVNMINANIAALMHSLTDDARAIDVPGYGRVEVAPEAFIFYTMNEGLMGTAEMNAATIDRGPVIELFPLQAADILKAAVPAVKRKIAKSVLPWTDETELDKLLDKNIHSIARFMDAVKERVQAGALPEALNTTRGSIDALCYTAMGRTDDVRQALTLFVINKAQEPGDREAMSMLLDSLF